MDTNNRIYLKASDGIGPSDNGFADHPLSHLGKTP